MKLTKFWLVLCLVFVIFTPGLYAQEPETSVDEGFAYTVQLNDTLSKLAEQYLGDLLAYPLIVEVTATKAETDASFTPINNPDLIEVGQKIWIPGPTSESAGTSTVVTTPAAPPTATPAPRPAASGPSGHIAFSFWNDHPSRCTYEINIINVPACLEGVAQCQATRRIFSLNNVSEPALSPDGTRLAFRGWGEPNKEDHPYINCADPHPHRFLGNTTLDGTEFFGTGGFWEDSHPDWSPDGNRLLFDTARNGDNISRILFIDANGANEGNPLIAGQQPSWAPDGQRFVYRGCDLTGNRCGLWQAYAVPMLSWNTGQNMISPILEESEAAHPDWSPVAEEIVYQSPVNGSWDLYLINVDGSNKRQLTSADTLEGLPAWSPDGQWIAYLGFDGLNWGIHIINRAGTVNHTLFTYDGGVYQVPAPVEPYGVRSWIDEQLSWSR